MKEAEKMKCMGKTNRRLKISLVVAASLAVLLSSAFFIYVSDYYRADDVANAILQSDAVTRAQKNLIVLPSVTPSDTALIFYPGAKVECFAYLPILEKIKRNCDITCILVRMPFNLAIFAKDYADAVIEQFPHIKNWYIAGHSMGGAMASAYASEHQDSIKGLILLGAYIYGGYPAGKALTVYGSFNTTVADKVDYTENVVIIEGGNHAQFGNYGRQKGDPDATISREEQQDIAVHAIKEFLTKR
ncbi:MAG TPA: alpha/beta fold hydrolase [Bacillota bacterium]|nr:alpha/beta fold hydrolase [Bacillota bacterium]